MPSNTTAADAAGRPGRRRWVQIAFILGVGVGVFSLSPARVALLEQLPDSLLTWSSRVFPQDPWPLILLGERRLAAGETRAAVEAFARVPEGTQSLRLGVDLADALRAAGRWDQSEAQARQLLLLEPNSSRLHRILGQCWLGRGDPGAALGSLETAVRLSPHDTEAWVSLAEARIERDGFRPETARVWEEGRRRNPGSVLLRWGLAETCVGLGRFADAELLLQGLSPPTQGSPRAREWYARALAARGTLLRRYAPDPARCAQADRDLTQSLLLNPNQPDARAELGLLAVDRGDWRAAREALEEAVRLRPYAHPFWFPLPRVYRALSLPTRAHAAEARFLKLVGTFETVHRETEALEATPHDVSRRLRLARLLLERDDCDAARVQVARVLSDAPTHGDALRLQREIEQTQGKR